jgi:chromosome segregation ATPase
VSFASLPSNGGQQVSASSEDVEIQASQEGAKAVELAKLKSLSTTELIMKIEESWHNADWLGARIKALENDLSTSKSLKSYGSKASLIDSSTVLKLKEIISENEKTITALTEEKKQILNEKQKLGDTLFTLASNRKEEETIRESSSLSLEQFSAQLAAKEIEMKKRISGLENFKAENFKLKEKIEELEADIVVKIQKLDKVEKELESLLSSRSNDSGPSSNAEDASVSKNKDNSLLPLKIEIHNLKNQLKVVNDYSDKITSTSQASINELKDNIVNLRKEHAEQLVELDGQLAEANQQIERLALAKNGLQAKLDNQTNDSGIFVLTNSKNSSRAIEEQRI